MREGLRRAITRVSQAREVEAANATADFLDALDDLERSSAHPDEAAEGDRVTASEFKSPKSPSSPTTSTTD